jgi:hypothetical protein
LYDDRQDEKQEPSITGALSPACQESLCGVSRLQHALGARDDALAMQYLMPNRTFDPKRPCRVR